MQRELIIGTPVRQKLTYNQAKKHANKQVNNITLEGRLPAMLKLWNVNNQVELKQEMIKQYMVVGISI